MSHLEVVLRYDGIVEVEPFHDGGLLDYELNRARFANIPVVEDVSVLSIVCLDEE